MGLLQEGLDQNDPHQRVWLAGGAHCFQGATSLPATAPCWRGQPGGAIRAQKVRERPSCSASCEDWLLAKGSASIDVLKTQLRAEAEADGRPGPHARGPRSGPTQVGLF